MTKREKLTKGEWAGIGLLCLLFLPIGLAIIVRWLAGKWVLDPNWEEIERLKGGAEVEKR